MTVPQSDVTVSRLVMGAGFLYIGSFGATEPAASAIESVPATAEWTFLGGTVDGATLRQEVEWEELNVDQLVDVAGRRVTKRVVELETSLAEHTLDNLDYVLNQDGTITNNASTQGSASPGVDTYEPSNNPYGEPTYTAVLLDGPTAGGLTRRVIVRKVVANASYEHAYSKDGQKVTPVTFMGHYVSSSIEPYIIHEETGAPTG